MTMHIHVGRNVPGCGPDEYPGCFSSAESALSFLRSLLSAQSGYYSDCCESECAGDSGCTCDACECDWCALSTAATIAVRDESALDTLASGRNVRWRFEAPEDSDEEIWAYHQAAPRECCELVEMGD